MIAKKLLLCGVLGAVTLLSTASFASYYHPHHHRSRIHFNHHHNSWRDIQSHHRASRGNHIVVHGGTPYGRVHHHH